MVRYYGRARQRIGSVNTNQPALKQAGCPGTVGKQGLIIQHLGKRVNCNLKTCGLPMSGLRCRYGVADAIGRDKTFMNIQNSNNPAIKDYCKQVVDGQNGIYCQWPQPRNRQNAGGVGNIWTSRRNHCEKTCSLGWKENYMSNHTPKELARNKKDAWLTIGECREGSTPVFVGFDNGEVTGCAMGKLNEIFDVTPYTFVICHPFRCDNAGAPTLILQVSTAALQNMPSTITVHFPATGGTVGPDLEGIVKTEVRFGLWYRGPDDCGPGCAGFGWDLNEEEAANAYALFKGNVGKTVKVTWT